jgi:hypothetical protein
MTSAHLLTFLLDEHLRGPLWKAIQRHNQTGGLPIDAVRIGDFDDLPLGMDDEAILRWIEQHNRILLTRDRRTVPRHVATHLAAGGHFPGIFIVRRKCKLKELIEHLELAAYAGNPGDYEDQLVVIP